MNVRTIPSPDVEVYPPYRVPVPIVGMRRAEILAARIVARIDGRIVTLTYGGRDD